MRSPLLDGGLRNLDTSAELVLGPEVGECTLARNAPSKGRPTTRSDLVHDHAVELVVASGGTVGDARIKCSLIVANELFGACQSDISITLPVEVVKDGVALLQEKAYFTSTKCLKKRSSHRRPALKRQITACRTGYVK